jgi:AcrR family transcriptional regulator
VLAAVEAAGELPLAEVTVLEITSRAGVSRKTFYELFDQRGDCLLAALQSSVARLAEVVGPAYRGQRSWARQVRAGLEALLAFFDEHPAHARLCVKAAFDDDPRLLAYRAQVSARFARALDAGRGKATTAAVSPVTAEALVGAVLAMLHERLLSADGPACAELLNPLMGMIALCFKGFAAARAELAVPLPSSPPAPPEARTGNPLQGVQTRLTYRTLRVLRAIELEPGSSNSAVAAAAGLGDLGQTSKLLKRLERLELLANDGPRAGERNAWRLTSRAEQMLATISKAAVRRATPQGA